MKTDLRLPCRAAGAQKLPPKRDFETNTRADHSRRRRPRKMPEVLLAASGVNADGRIEPHAARSLRRDFGDCRTYLAYGDPARTRLETTNPIERCIREIERRTVPIRSFTTVPGIERIIHGIIACVLNQNRDMPMTEFTQHLDTTRIGSTT